MDAKEKEIYLTVTEVAELLRVSKMTVYRMVNTREIESTRVGRAFRILAGEFYRRFPECRSSLCARNADGSGTGTGPA